MKRIISIILVCSLMLSACSPTVDTNVVQPVEDKVVKDVVVEQSEVVEEQGQEDIFGLDVKGLDDEVLLRHIEDNIYEELVEELNNEDYFVENVEAVYYPKEYIEALSSNSRGNVYFGYTASELNSQFQGTKYVFTLGDDGKTCVIPMGTLTEDIYVKTMEDVIVGSGVILICVTVSLVAAPSAPAVSAIFAASAKTGTAFALESGTLAGVSAAITKGYETESLEQAFKASVDEAGEGFKWGAITGAIFGGAGETIALKGATLSGLTMNQAAKIQKETGWPLDIIKSIHSNEEYMIYKNAGVQAERLETGAWAFTKEIDWKRIDSDGKTNVERVTQGLAPIDANGNSYELHHVGQKADSPLAILTWDEHHSNGNYKILHYAEEGKNISDAEWNRQKKEFWKEILR